MPPPSISFLKVLMSCIICAHKGLATKGQRQPTRHPWKPYEELSELCSFLVLPNFPYIFSKKKKNSIDTALFGGVSN